MRTSALRGEDPVTKRQRCHQTFSSKAKDDSRLRLQNEGKISDDISETREHPTDVLNYGIVPVFVAETRRLRVIELVKDSRATFEFQGSLS